MFYSRPKVKPLRWDLEELPVFDGSYSHDARTTDDRPVWFRYRNGWLQSAYGEVGAKEADWGQIISAESIGPPYDMGILPQQICEILELTVQGRKVITTAEELFAARQERGVMDFSGETTYWESYHTASKGEVRDFVEDIAGHIPNTTLLHYTYDRAGRTFCREISYFVESDGYVTIAIDTDREKLRTLLARKEIPSREALRLPYSIGIKAEASGDLRKMIDGYGADKLGLKYAITPTTRINVRTQFRTVDEGARTYMQALLSAIDRRFCKGLEFVDLETSAVIKEKPAAGNYSAELREWCEKSPRNYLGVSVETPQARKDKDIEPMIEGDKTLFYGYRPFPPPVMHDIGPLQAQADAGDASAQYRLGYIYASGHGRSAQDYVAAYYWMSLAVLTGGYSEADLQNIAFQLDQKQIATLNAGIKEWIESRNSSK